MKNKRVLSLIVILAMMFSLLPQFSLPVFAASNSSTIDVSDDTNSILPTGVSYASNVFTIGTGANGSTITVTGTTTTNSIAVATGVTGLTLILNGASITNTSESPINLQGNAIVTIELTGSITNILDARNAPDVAGLCVPSGATINIGGTGTINATGGNYGAGIGGGKSSAGGTIQISGGTVNATGGNYGAGIGGGTGRAGGTIRISNGVVDAKGGTNAAGIGGGSQGAGGTITISNGVVTAKGGIIAAGIGGGSYGSAGAITIDGGRVEATGGSSTTLGGAGIGGGCYGAGGTITISNGVVTAKGGKNATGIGGGSSGAYGNGAGGIITINDSSIITAVSTGDRYAIEAVSGSSGSIINAKLNAPISTTAITYLKLGSGIDSLALPANYKSFAFNATSTKEIFVYSDASCITPLGSIVTDPGGDSLIPVIDLSTYPEIVTMVNLSSATPGSVTISGDITKTYDGTAVSAPAYTSTSTGAATIEYKIQGSDNSTYTTTAPINAGSYTVRITVAADASYTRASAEQNFTIGAKALSSSNVTISGISASYPYTGTAITPEPTVKYGAVTLVKNTDYIVSYSNNTNTGTATVTITFTGNYSGSVTQTFSIAARGGNGGGSSSPKPAPNQTDISVAVDGKSYNIGTVNVKDNTATVTVDQVTFGEMLSAAKDSVVIPVTKNAATVVSQFVVKNVEDMNEKGVSLTVQAGKISYNIPTSSINTEAILSALGVADPSLVPLNVNIKTDINQTAQTGVNSAVTATGAKVVVPPVQFEITATYNDKTYTVEKFENFINRSVEITEEQAQQITTAVVVETDGSTRHVPTFIYQEDGKWYARISSLTNSTYVLIFNETGFADAEGKWYQSVVDEMGSRRIITGVGNNNFEGDRDITRAEFAAILVRALGLPADGTSTFTDVPSDAWYNGVVATAAKYGIVRGIGRDMLAPDAKITREEAMQMIFNASKITKYTALSGVDNTRNFSDYGEQSNWATSAVGFSLNNGLIQGHNGKINPRSNITRAETATIVLRLLQKSNLVDVR